ncbi:hypothetical protein QR680_007586 [Steinernema hermaphroditum]|uniref:AAA+ ATPase domain-containing protein n=1 Tax=Steinernema hermaphroditum TaxID=289476 RepID=A0AA39M5L4_9BILA|nr:hypothetical protein QR680_007586 [Steinernema hermaphroditum]
MSVAGKNKKKEKAFAECPGCPKTILSRDLERHKAECGCEDTPKLPYLTAKKLVALTAPAPDSSQAIPQDCFGWNKQTCALVSSDVLQQMRVMARTPCILRTLPERKVVGVVVLWSTSEMGPLRVHIPGQPNERLVEMEVVQSDSVRTVAAVSLEPISEKVPPFYGSKQFADFVRVYFANTFLIAGKPMACRYFGSICELRVQTNRNDGELVVLKTTTKTKIILDTDIADVCAQLEKLSLNIDNIGGCEDAKAKVQKFLIEPVQSKTPPCSVMLWGITGTGKTLFLNVIKRLVSASSVLSLKDPLFTQHLTHLSSSNNVVLIDDYESEAAAQHIEAICTFLDNGNTLVLAVREVEAVDMRLRRRIPVEVEMRVPSQGERIEILKVLLNQRKALKELSDEQMKDVAMQTHGYTGADLKSALKIASMEKEGSLSDRLLAATRQVRPTGLRQFILEVPNVRWEDIGGYEELKKEIQQAVVWPQMYPEVFARFGIQPPTGILLYGPPGCSKTLVARALASQSKLNFLAVKGPELFSKWVGESEKAIRDIFHRARQVAPAILFFDEIDAVAVARGSDQGGNRVGDRVLTQLLTELDGLEKKSGVIVLAATNRPDTIDGALLRPGRLDRAIYVTLPDVESRKSIINIHFERMQIHPDVKVEELAERTQGYSGAEVVAMCRNAALIAMRENLHAEHVTGAHFDESIRSVVPRTDKRTLEAYDRFKRGEPSKDEEEY